MTTTVTIKASNDHHVHVAQIGTVGGNLLAPVTCMPPGTERIFHVTSVTDLSIHEVQPDEHGAEPYFRFGLGEFVNLNGTQRVGEVIARSEYSFNAASYLVRFTDGNGDLKKEWFNTTDLKPAIVEHAGTAIQQ